MSRYICYFEHRNRVGILKTAVPSIAEVEGGFWVDCGYEFCKTSEAKYWIPPSVIKDVEKV